MVIVFRSDIRSAERIVVKLGTDSVVTVDGVFDYDAMDALVQQMLSSKREYLLVSSGAICLGNHELGWERSNELVKKQAASAVGQPILMNTYRDIFGKYSVVVAQNLLSRFDTPIHDYNAKRSLECLLSHGVVPIINENDAISTEEITFGDNDILAARKAKLLGADLLVILSSVEGIYDDFDSKDRSLLSYIENPSVVPFMNASSENGTGGIHSKIKAAQYAAGIPVVVAGMQQYAVLSRILSGESIGTVLYCSENRFIEK
jgi:glutamate 5-kinase